MDSKDTLEKILNKQAVLPEHIERAGLQYSCTFAYDLPIYVFEEQIYMFHQENTHLRLFMYSDRRG